MTLLEEITARRKAFHRSIAEHAARISGQPRVNHTPGVRQFIVKPKIADHPLIDVSHDQAWEREICGQAEYISPPTITVSLIQRAVCRHFNLTFAQLTSRRRTDDLVRARWVGYFLARELTRNSLPEIGRRFGGKDHTTVLHGLRTVDGLLHNNDPIADDIKVVHELLV